jgi:hypothetical protein
VIVPVVIAGVVSALAMGSTKPRTSYVKTRSIGSRSGVSYEVEDFPGAGFLVVRAPDGSEGVLMRKLGPVGTPAGFDWTRGRGNAGTLEVMKQDFGVSARSQTGSK